MKKYIMALDQGTTSSRCILFDQGGNICGAEQQEFEQIYPNPGWVEHDPMVILDSQVAVAKELLGKMAVPAEAIAAIGITNQRETAIVWNRYTGKPVYNAIVWQCRRTSEMIDALVRDGLGDYVTETTGLVPDAYFSGTKVKWILDNVEGARAAAERGDLLFGTVDTWLIWNLTGGSVFVTDYSNASRTMLYDIHNLCWDKKILEYLAIPECMLPEVKPSSQIYGVTDKALFGGEIPIAGAAGDQQAALFGQCCFNKGEVKNTYGTGCFLLMNTGDKPVASRNGLITTLAASTAEGVQYVLEGSVFVAGAAIQWLRDEMQMIGSAAESEELAGQVPDSNGVYIVPAFTGLGAPYWNQYARGTIVGLTRGVNKAHFTRAVLESIAYQTYDVLKAMEQDIGEQLSELRVDGGASANDLLLQFQADILRTTVKKPECIETTALGAAYLAGLAVGYWENREQIKDNWNLKKTYEPQMEAAEANHRIDGWQKAIDTTIGWGSF